MCPVQCLEGNTITQILNDEASCCDKAEVYVSTISDSNEPESDSDSASQCGSTAYNNASIKVDDFENRNSEGRQYVLHNAIKFNCSGCVSKVSVYTKSELENKQVFTVEIWSDRSAQNNNTLALSLKQQLSLELLVSDSIKGDGFFMNSKEVNDSLCFESGDIFGITPSGNFQFLSYKEAANRKAFARDLPNCDLLRTVYYPENSETVNEPLIVVEVTDAPLNTG